MAQQTKLYSMYRVLAAVSVTLGPFCFLALPTLLFPQPYESATAQFTALAEHPTNAVFGPLLIQLLGAIFFVPAVLGMVHLLLQRHRLRIVGHIGGGLALLGTFSAMTLIGMELVQVLVILTDADPQAMVALAVAIQQSTLFGVFLFTALLGLFIGTLLLCISVWRAGIIPVWPLVGFMLPIVMGFLPLPPRISEIGAITTLMVPFLWISWLMYRGTAARPMHAGAGVQEVQSAGRAV